MHAIFSRRLFVFASSSSSSPVTKLLKTTLSHRSQSRHFLTHLLPYGFSSSSSAATRFAPSLLSRSQIIHRFFFAGNSTSINTHDLKLKFRNVMESRAGFESATDFTGLKNRGWKSWINGRNGVVFGLILANAAVFTLWKVRDTQWMNDNFVFSVFSLTTGRLHTLITSGFSQNANNQVIFNMVGLYYFGTRIARTLGPFYVLKLYIAGTLGGCVIYFSEHALIGALKRYGFINKDGQKDIPLGYGGAKGSVFAMAIVDILLCPKVSTYFELMLRVPAMLEVLGFVDDFLAILGGEADSLSSDAIHIGGGAIAAAIAWSRIRKGRV